MAITSELTDIDNFYLGVSYLKMEKPQPKKKPETLKKLNSGNAFKEEVMWFLGLAYTVEQ
ncbi:MAG: hypothetical protein IPO92_18115 [Saprospiraceae bacterium]|nr:hypothetical protein [Saprospiraceae bacterium]